MIKIKLSSVGNENSTEMNCISGEHLDFAVKRAVGHLIPEDQSPNDHFVVLVNGMKVHGDLWPTVRINSSDNILIAPMIKSGDSGSLLRTAIIIAATVYLGPVAFGAAGFAAGSVGAALITAGVTIGTSLLLNAMIPPPVPEGIDNGTGNLNSSQMYAISSQSNQTKKFGSVPKVYGTHRVYPNIAANPYTELEADPATGKTIQYFYAIYDFGLGPMTVNNIQIGDTPISDFSDVQFRLVDPNKPPTSEGTWDDATFDSFEIYKGDIEETAVTTALNKDQGTGTPDESEAIRTASPNTTSVNQELTVTLTNPSGLYSISPSGTFGNRQTNVDIFFSKVGEDDWHGFNDFDFVSSYTDSGGIDTNSGRSFIPLSLFAGDVFPYVGPYWDQIGNDYDTIRTRTFAGTTSVFRQKTFGILKGATEIIALTGDLPTGSGISFLGTAWGRVTGSVPHIESGYSTYTIDAPAPVDFPIYSYTQVYESGLPIAEDSQQPLRFNPQVREKIIGRTSIIRNSTTPVYSTFKFTPREIGDYKIRVTRIQTISTYTSQVQDNLTWSSITTRFDRAPILTDKRHVFLEIKIKATNQLNGAVQNLSAVCSSVLERYDEGTTTWVKEVSSNPAWVYVDLLTGEVNKRAISKSRLDTASLLEWEEFCNEVPTSPPSQDFVMPRFSINFVVDYAPTLQSLLNQVCNSAQASLNIIDGKYGVLIDKLRTTPVQIFTPRNSADFSSSRNYTSQPNALKVSYIDPEANWEQREVLVYDNGFDPDTAETFDEVSSFGCTSDEQAWRLGRYMLAQNRLRQENIRITVDFESLVCTRGDYVQITQDVMRAGGTPARIKSVVGNRVVIDDAIESGPFSYGFVYRAADGAIHTNTLTLVSSDTFDLDGPDIPAVGDLFIIGEVGSIVLDCLVKSIEPSSDLSAILTLVEKADAIYTAESTDVIPDYTPQISSTQDVEFQAPGEVENLIIADSYYGCSGSGLNYFVLIDWDVPAGAIFDVFEVWVDSGEGYNLVDTTKESFYLYQADEDNLGVEHKFKVLAVSASGKKLDIGAVGEVTQVISAKTTPPSDVGSLNIDITNEVLQLVWEQVDDCSVEEYLIRYSPLLNGTWEQSIPLLRAPRNATLASAQARTGTYLIKAIDYAGNESLIATAAITTIPNLFNLNIVEEVTDAPAWTGSKDRTKVDADSLILKNTILGGVDTAEYYSEGFYYYENFADLGDIYTARLQSLIQAEGFSLQDLMSNWTDLSLLDSMSHAGFSDWSVETQYRTTDSINVMSDWATLSSIDPISEGSQDQWTAWKTFTIGDATGRIFAFRLRLISNLASVSPRVFDGTIKVDMPDREEPYEDISAPSGGVAVNYSPTFYGPGTTPNVQITLQNGAAGDYWSYDYRTLDGFYIRFFNSTGTPVARTFDAAVRGYGYKATSVI